MLTSAYKCTHSPNTQTKVCVCVGGGYVPDSSKTEATSYPGSDLGSVTEQVVLKLLL